MINIVDQHFIRPYLSSQPVIHSLKFIHYVYTISYRRESLFKNPFNFDLAVTSYDIRLTELYSNYQGWGVGGGVDDVIQVQ